LALISVSVAISQTPAYDTRQWLMHRVVNLFMHQVFLVLVVPIHEGMARLSWPGWLVICQDGLPSRRWSPIPVLTGPIME